MILNTTLSQHPADSLPLTAEATPLVGPTKSTSEPAANVPTNVDEAFDRCAALFHRFFLVRLGGDGHAADDLMQQLWVAADRGARAVPHEEVEFWLRDVARKLLHTHWRRAGVQASIVRDAAVAEELSRRLESGQAPIELLARREVLDQLLLALTELPREDHDALVLHYIHRTAHAELAARLGITERAVEGRLYRARRALRERLSEHDTPTE